jgi:general secretion pathway protein C
VQPVVERNIFCSSCAPPVKVVAAGAVGEAVGEATCGTVGPFALLATLYSEDDAWSVAAVQDITTNVSGVVRIGSIAPGSSKITSIEPKRVRYVTSGTPGCIEMVDGAKAVAAPAPTIAEAGVAVPSADDGFPAGDLDRGIKKVSDTQFDLQRGLVDKILGDTATLARQARIVPAVKDGKANGFRLYAIRPGSVFARIGLENGDTIHVINGQEISTPDRALEVYTKLRSASHLTISITRRGEPKTIDYSIR